MKTESSACPICHLPGGNNFYTVPSVRLGGLSFGLVQCTSCGLVRTDPRPTSESISQLYGPEIYRSDKKLGASLLNTLIAREQVSYLQQATRKRGGILLDVGCGSGGFLAEATHAGYDGYGLEPYQSLPDDLPNHLRQRIIRRPLESANLPPAHYDIITMFHVLEHLYQPIEVLRLLRNHLKPSGRLVLELPNFASAESKWLNTYWHHLDVPFHLWHFTPITIGRIIEEAGFSMITLQESALLRPVWLLNYIPLGAQRVSLKLKETKAWLCKTPRLAFLYSLLSCTGFRLSHSSHSPMMRMVCKIT